MELQVGRLLKEKGRSETFAVEEPCPSGLEEAGVQGCTGPLHLEGRATSTGDGILVSGRIQVGLTMLCSRCLAPYPLEVEAGFQEEFVPRTRSRERDEVEERGPGSPARLSTFEDDDGVEFFDGHRIDLGPLVREQLLMALPMKALCREDCRGLCPVCGQNLNAAPCGCQVDETDPRLAVLGDLLDGGGRGRRAGDE
ncbi:YceD family protein [Limnochorda pilosa]|uniref:DUF177 domain-containing protein n=1 Tax=Limnochorda pilosa TaxID=1555112 RepID=A0A0K2SKB1_LIMPI|nr:DUF177 domain-containing protein [Limnochorda pilosa]BAS27457.1 hypothetical protein LIP_1611 [Limnochorda pilosa]